MSRTVPSHNWIAEMMQPARVVNWLSKCFWKNRWVQVLTSWYMKSLFTQAARRDPCPERREYWAIIILYSISRPTIMNLPGIQSRVGLLIRINSRPRGIPWCFQVIFKGLKNIFKPWKWVTWALTIQRVKRLRDQLTTILNESSARRRSPRPKSKQYHIIHLQGPKRTGQQN